MEAAKTNPTKNSKLHDASNWADNVGDEGDVSLPEGDIGAGVRSEGGDDGSSNEGARDGGGRFGIIGDGTAKYEGAGEPRRRSICHYNNNQLMSHLTTPQLSSDEEEWSRPVKLELRIPIFELS